MRYSRGLAIGGLLLASACGKPHNDVLIFGTNTQFGIDVSASAASGGTPKLNIGYNRQEAVWLPLVVNGLDSPAAQQIYRDAINQCIGGSTDEDVIKLCREKAYDTVKYMGSSGGSVNGGSGGVGGTVNDHDAYSVFASFGATFGAQGNATSSTVEAQGGIAQFFATGVAAQRLGANASIGDALAVQPTNKKTEDALKGQVTAEKARADAEKARANFQQNVVQSLCVEAGEERCAAAVANADVLSMSIDDQYEAIEQCANFGALDGKWGDLVASLELNDQDATKQALDGVSTAAQMRRELELLPALRDRLAGKAKTSCPTED